MGAIVTWVPKYLEAEKRGKVGTITLYKGYILILLDCHTVSMRISISITKVPKSLIFPYKEDQNSNSVSLPTAALLFGQQKRV